MALYTSVDQLTAKQYVWGKVKPYDNNFPSFLSINGKGGFMYTTAISTATIPTSHQVEGMIAYHGVSNDHYRLNSAGGWELIELTESGSNGLYEYKRTVDSNGYIIEMYKWDRGKLEYFIRGPRLSCTSAYQQFWVSYSSTVSFPVNFVSTADAMAQGTAVGELSNEGTAVWGDIWTCTSSAVRGRAMGTQVNGKFYMHMTVTGHWK